MSCLCLCLEGRGLRKWCSASFAAVVNNGDLSAPGKGAMRGGSGEGVSEPLREEGDADSLSTSMLVGDAVRREYAGEVPWLEGWPMVSHASVLSRGLALLLLFSVGSLAPRRLMSKSKRLVHDAF